MRAVRAHGEEFLAAARTLLITSDGHEVLNPVLPYSPKDIESAMHR